MKLKTFYLSAFILSIIGSLYFSFGHEPQVHLWSWFGYRFGLSSTPENILPKLTAILFGVLYFFSVKKEQVVQK